MPSRPSSVFDRLLGLWIFVREIPGYASATGEARITPEGDGSARYEETALVSLVQGGTLHATRCYFYRRLPRPANGLQILFCDTQQLFHELEFQQRDDGTLEAHARFLCAADEYVSEYTLDSQQRLRVQHTVRGPRKNYQVETLYERQPELPRATNVSRASAM